MFTDQDQINSGLLAENVKQQFPVFKKYPKLVYLDSAATSQRPQVVIDAISSFYAYENANIHRGLYDLSNKATKKYEEVREKVAGLLNSKVENIGFTKGTTESINIIAESYLKNRIKSGDNLVTTIMEHHANFLPWQRLCNEIGCELRIVQIDQDGNLDMDHLSTLIDDRTRLMSVVHISNTLGTINPINEIIDLAHQKGIPTMIDAAQSAALYELDHEKLGYDFLAFSGHKIFGPFGIGILFVSEKYRSEIQPYNVGGGMIENVSVEETRYREFPYNLEAGTSNISAVVGLGAAVDFLRTLDRPSLQKKMHELTEYGYQKLTALEKVKMLSNPKKRTGILSFNIDEIHPHDIASMLNKDDIAVRAGMHCTQPLLQNIGIPATVRASLSIYNGQSDIDRLVSSVEELIEFWS